MAADWDDRFAGHWDDAFKGSCAQSAGMLRSLLDELAAGSGVDACSVYLDLAKFHDNVFLLKLSRLAEKVQHLPLPLLLSLQAYLSPRFLRAEGCLSEPTLLTGAIGPGCRRASSLLARVALYNILGGLRRRHPMVQFRR